jgi:hypothetical protein
MKIHDNFVSTFSSDRNQQLENSFDVSLIAEIYSPSATSGLRYFSTLDRGGGRHDRDRMVVGFIITITTYAIRAYYPL